LDDHPGRQLPRNNWQRRRRGLEKSAPAAAVIINHTATTLLMSTSAVKAGMLHAAYAGQGV